MSIRATNFVRRLRGLSPGLKSVAFVLADHDNHKGGGAYPSMATVAEEAGYAFRQNASSAVQELADRKVIKGRQSGGGRPTTWYFNYDLVGCGPDIILVPVNRSRRAAVNCSPETAVKDDQPQSPDLPTAVEKAANCSPVTAGRVLEGVEGGRLLKQFPQDQQGANLHEPGPSRSQVERAIRKTASRVNPSTNGDQRKHLHSAIFHKKVGAAFFDATNAKMKRDDCIREAVSEAALSLTVNRSVELKGLNHNELAMRAWERIQSGKGFEALLLVNDVKHVVSAVSHCITDAALEFMQKRTELKMDGKI